MSDEQYDVELIDGSGDHRYFSQIPHLINDLPLSPAAKALYLHIKRRAGEKSNGVCYEAKKNIAFHLGISIPTIRKAQRELEDWGLIRTRKKPGKHGEFDHDEITVTNIWRLNERWFDPDTPSMWVYTKDNSPIPRRVVMQELRNKDSIREWKKLIREAILK